LENRYKKFINEETVTVAGPNKLKNSTSGNTRGYSSQRNN